MKNKLKHHLNEPLTEICSILETRKIDTFINKVLSFNDVVKCAVMYKHHAHNGLLPYSSYIMHNLV
jgi:hypothetical protein